MGILKLIKDVFSDCTNFLFCDDIATSLGIKSLVIVRESCPHGLYKKGDTGVISKEIPYFSTVDFSCNENSANNRILSMMNCDLCLVIQKE